MESQIKQLALGSRPWTEKVRDVLRDEKGRFRKEVRPGNLAEIMGISIQKANSILSKLDEYRRVSIHRGCCKYILVG